jgi:hypothetical protein
MKNYASGAARLNPIFTARGNIGRTDKIIIGITILAVLYNAFLAILNAHLANITFGLVAATEIFILSLCLGILVRAGVEVSSRNIVYFLCVFIMLAVILSLINQRVFVDSLRNMMVIAIFICLGRSINHYVLVRVFFLLSAIVLIFLIMELASIKIYAELFKPALYFGSTRGVADFDLDDSGIFRNALGFEGRFSFGLFSGPRTSSVFLEQVSLANYAAVVCLFLLSLWPSLKPKDRILNTVTVLLIILSNNTRTTSILLLLSIVGYFLYPRMPRYANALIAPVIIILGVTIYNLYPGAGGDDFIGRISHTGEILSSMNLPEYFGMRIDRLGSLMDSGYPYVICSSTVFGFIAYWLFVSFVMPQKTCAEKRCAYGLSVYIFVNLLIGGTAIFSIKVAAPLWLLIGYMSRKNRHLEGIGEGALGKRHRRL